MQPRIGDAAFTILAFSLNLGIQTAMIAGQLIDLVKDLHKKKLLFGK